MPRLPKCGHTRWRPLGVAFVLALPLAEFGHVLSYVARYGERGMVIQTLGVHAYFPSLLKLSLGIAGAALLGVLLLFAGGRLLLGKGLGLKARRGVPALDFFLVLASSQLAIHVLQETSEAVAADAPLTLASLGLVVAWGVIGQVPVAFIGALCLSWITVRLERVLTGFRTAFQRLAALGTPRPLAPTASSARIAWECNIRPRDYAHSLAKRGPPSLLSAPS